jgi:hypothetical protein
MQKKELLIIVIICIILIIAVAYGIIDVVDSKLNKMPIKLPAVTPPKVVINMCDGKAVDQYGNDVKIINKSVDKIKKTDSTDVVYKPIDKPKTATDVQSEEESHASSFNDSNSSHSSQSSQSSESSSPTSHMVEHDFAPVIQYSDIEHKDIDQAKRPSYIKEGFSIRGHNIDNYI